eukprot:g473.t1
MQQSRTMRICAAVIVMGMIMVNVNALAPTRDYDNDGLCIWKCSGHGKCSSASEDALPSCRCEDDWSGKGCQMTTVSVLSPEEKEVSAVPSNSTQSAAEMNVTIIPRDPGMKGVSHEMHTVKLIRSIRKRIKHLQALPEIASTSGELEELQLALDTVGGTQVIWNQELVDHVVAQNVRTALDHATPALDPTEGDFRLFKK